MTTTKDDYFKEQLIQSISDLFANKWEDFELGSSQTDLIEAYVKKTIYDTFDDNVYVCRECGGKNIYEEIWVHINEPDINQSEGQGTWCSDCSEDHGAVTLKEFLDIWRDKEPRLAWGMEEE